MDEFATRRANLAKQLPNNSVVLLSSSQLLLRNGDAEFAFRQDSDFYYLTGFCEPNSVLVLSKDQKGKLTYTLFNRPNDPAAETWNGKRAGQQGACADYGADVAYDVAEINTTLPALLLNKEVVYYPLTAQNEFDLQVLSWVRSAKKSFELKYRIENSYAKCAPESLVDLLPLLAEMRLFKSAYEIDHMRKAAEISAEGHNKLLENCKDGQFEYQLEAIFNAYCLESGCRGLAYNSIVAGGNNACTLHYTQNDQRLKDGDLVLIDAGGEYNNYAADITRTFPVSGKFTTEQRQIYALVLEAQLAGIAQVKPGNIWPSVQDVMVKILVTGLVELGILKGNVKQLIQDKEIKKFYMHGSGHWLGLDVHDRGLYKKNDKWREFAPGMVLTVEPGLYIANNFTGIDHKWYGIGVRIEDDVLVTKHGNEVLSSKALKQIDEIERARI